MKTCYGRVPVWLRAAGTLVVAALAGLACVRPAPVAHGTAQWQKVWFSSFDGPSGGGINGRFWRYQTGQGIFGTGETEVMTNSRENVHLDGKGDLYITATHQGYGWTSGRIQSRRAFTPPAGGELRVIASIQQPGAANGLGYWPAFWMLGNGTWPQHGEIDIMEDVNALSEHSGSLHCGNLWQVNPDGTLGPCHEHLGRTSGLRPCPECQSGYHSYSVIIDQRRVADAQIRWYLDHREFFSVSEQQLGVAVWNTAINHAFTIILDLAIGGSFPDRRCSCVTPTVRTSGGSLRVRYVAVYQR
jgi:beta-glucanase (GH16 family)